MNETLLSIDNLSEIDFPKFKKCIKGMLSFLKSVQDPRDCRGKKYPMYYILTLYLTSVVAGKTDCVNARYFILQNLDYISSFMPEVKELGVPSHDCFTNCLAQVPEEIIKKLLKVVSWELYDWDKDRLGIGEVEKITWKKKEGTIKRGENPFEKKIEKVHLKRHLAVDGKASRGATDKKGGGNTPYTAGLVDPSACFYLGLVNIPNGKNQGEATKVRQELEENDLSGCIITADALHTSCATMDTIYSSRGEFLLKLNEGSHPKQYKLVLEILQQQKEKRTAYEKRLQSAKKYGQSLEPDPEITLQTFSATEKYNGKLRKYSIELCQDQEGLLANYNTHISQVAHVKVQTFDILYDENGEAIGEELESEYECCLFISCILSAQDALNIYIKHWGIEVSHWFLDLYMKEDQSRARKGCQIYNRAALLRIGLNLLKLLEECIEETQGLSMNQKFTFLQTWVFVSLNMILGYQQDCYLKLALVYEKRRNKCLSLHEEAGNQAIPIAKL